LKIETGKKKGQFYETNTIADFHKQVNKFISLAIDEYNLDIKNPYSRFTIEKAETHRQFLTPSELAKFVKLYDVRHDVCLDSHLCDTLQMFLFMVGSGLRVSDSGRLQGLNVVEDTVQLRMQKTKRLKMGITFPLSAFALKYLPKHIENGKLFQYKTTQTFNRNLRYISTELLNIKKEVTSHIARHTFATSFILAGGRVEVLKNLLGHSDIRTTQIYIHLTQTVEREELKLLDAFLKFE
jgi:site-specific recombinase XerD